MSDIEIYYLSIDPGEKKSVGCCGYDSNFILRFMITIHENEVIQFLAREDLKTVKICIMEDYSVFPQKARQHVYSKLTTVRVIGRVESWAELNKIQLVKQPSKIKPTGYKFLGERPLPRSNPQSHALDAHVHAVYWGVVNGKISPEKLLNPR